MRERPILMSGSNVRAILEDRKTHTRRVVKPQPPTEVVTVNRVGKWTHFENTRESAAEHDDHGPNLKMWTVSCPYEVGMRLWVKENHRLVDCTCPETCRRPGMVYYEADESGYANAFNNRLRPSIFMPRWASRLTLEIESVRVERVQDISEEDARAEGVERDDSPCEHEHRSCAEVGCVGPGKYVSGFANLWDSINAKRGFPWSSNPWVWVVSFRRVEQEVRA